jgi:hypothetical protein
MRYVALSAVACLLLIGSLPGVVAAHRPGDPPHQLYQIGDFKPESGEVIKDFAMALATINPDSVTGHYAAGGFLPADVDQINGEVERLLDIVTQRGARLK